MFLIYIYIYKYIYTYMCIYIYIKCLYIYSTHVKVYIYTYRVSACLLVSSIILTSHIPKRSWLNGSQMYLPGPGPAHERVNSYAA